jgi:PAS domain S-box-containing protein
MAKQAKPPTPNKLPLLSQVNFLVKNTLPNFKTLAEWTSEFKKLTIEQLIEWYDLADGIVETTKEPLIVLNQDLKIVIANQAFSELFQIPEEAYLGKDFLQFADNSFNEQDIKNSLQRVLTKKIGFENIEWGKHLPFDGDKKFSLSGRQITLKALGGRLVLLTLKDVTRERELEQGHIDSKVILESITDAFIAYDKNWRYTYVNKQAEKILGKTRKELLGKIIWDVYPEARKTEVGEKIREAARSGKSIHLETFYKPRDRWYEFNIYPLKTGLTTYFRDITEEKKVEQQKDEFISVISHELKTPITAISAFSQILNQKAQRAGDSESLKYLQRIEFYTHRLTSLITGLLNSENLRASQFKFNDKEFSLDELIAQTVDDLRPSIPNYNLIIRGKSKKNLYADPERIHQVLINLILNAVRYSPTSDKVIIRVLADKKQVIIGIRDFGIGISKENQQRIFDRFFQVNSPKKELSSIGLGLDISAGIVKHYGGTIWVKSTEGRGSTFCFTLPLKSKKKS